MVCAGTVSPFLFSHVYSYLFHLNQECCEELKMSGHSKSAVFCIVFSLGLAGCGGGGGGGGGGGSVTGPSYSGTTTAVVMDATNAQAVESDASKVAGDIINSQGASAAFGVVIEGGGSGVPSQEVTHLTAEIVHRVLEQSQGSNLLVGATLSYVDLNNQVGPGTFCGGSITYPDSVDTNSSTLDITMTFNDLCFVGDGSYPQVTMNGTVRLIETDTYFTVIFSNLTMTMGSETFTLNASTTCDLAANCTVDFVGSDGNTYRVGGMSISGDNSAGYNYSATFYHPVSNNYHACHI